MNRSYVTRVLDRVTLLELLILLLLVGIAAAMAQAATDRVFTWRGLLQGLVASLFVIGMSWIGLGAFGFGVKTDDQRLWVSGLAAFGAKYLLRGFNTVLEKFAQNPRLVAMRIAALLRRSASVISPDGRKEK